MEMGIEPRGLLGLAEEMAGRAREEDAGHAALAVLAAHAALEAMVNRWGGETIGSFNYRARFLPKWHDLCERTIGRQLEAAPGGADLDQVPADQTCPQCGSPRRSAVVSPPTAKAYATAPPPWARGFQNWTGEALTLAAVLYGTLVTVAGVVVAPSRWWWRVVYGVTAIGLLLLGMFRFRDQTIKLVGRYLRWEGRGLPRKPPPGWDGGAAPTSES